MLLRKVNAVFALVSTLLLMDHAIFQAVRMLSKGSVEQNASSLPRILFAVMMIHAIISIVLGILGHKGAEKRKCNSYPALNRGAIFQRAGGVLMILLTVLHILGAVGVMTPPKIVHAVLPPLFFAVVLAHTAISTGKAFITLGIGNGRFYKIASVFVKVLCGATLVADVVGFYLYQV